MSIRIVPPENPGIRELKHWCQAVLHFEPALEYMSRNDARRELYAKSNWVDSEPFAQSKRTRDQAIGHIRNQHKMIDVIAEMQDYRQANVAWNFWDLCENDPDFGNVRTEMDGMIAVTFNQAPGCSTSEQILAWVELVTCFYDSSMKVKGLQDIMAHERNLGGLLEFLKIGRNVYTNLDALTPLFPPNELHQFATPAPFPFHEFEFTPTGKAVYQDDDDSAHYRQKHPVGREAKVALDSAAEYDRLYTGTSRQAPAQQRAAADAQARETAARTPAGTQPAQPGRNPGRGGTGVGAAAGVAAGPAGAGGPAGAARGRNPSGPGPRASGPAQVGRTSGPTPVAASRPLLTGSRNPGPINTRPPPPPMGGPAAAQHGPAAGVGAGTGTVGTPISKAGVLTPVRTSGYRPRTDASPATGAAGARAAGGAAAGGAGGGGGGGGGGAATRSGPLAGMAKALLPRWK